MKGALRDLVKLQCSTKQQKDNQTVWPRHACDTACSTWTHRRRHATARANRANTANRANRQRLSVMLYIRTRSWCPVLTVLTVWCWRHPLCFCITCVLVPSHLLPHGLVTPPQREEHEHDKLFISNVKTWMILVGLYWGERMTVF